MGRLSFKQPLEETHVTEEQEEDGVAKAGRDMTRCYLVTLKNVPNPSAPMVASSALIVEDSALMAETLR